VGLATLADLSTVRFLLTQILDEYGEKASKAIKSLENRLDEAIPVLGLPKRYRTVLHNTSSLKRMNEKNPPLRKSHSHLSKSRINSLSHWSFSYGI